MKRYIIHFMKKMLHIQYRSHLFNLVFNKLWFNAHYNENNFIKSRLAKG